MQRASKVDLLTNKLDSLDVGGTIGSDELIESYWGVKDTKDYFIRRSFSVALCHAKKNLGPNKKFITHKRTGIITRISL